MLPLQRGVFPFAANAPAQQTEEQKTTNAEEPPFVPSASPSASRPPSLESQRLAWRVQAAWPKEPKTEVSAQEFATFLAFCSEWSKMSSNNFLWSNFSTYQQFMQTAANSDIAGMLNRFFDQYRRLKDFKGQNREQVRLKNEFVRNFWAVCTIFNFLCERDEHSFESTWGNCFAQYCSHYSATIHPHYRIVQRFANFAFQLMEKEIVYSEDKGRGVVQVDYQRRLGFCRDTDGYLPIPFAHNPDDLEVIYLHYGQDVLPSGALPQLFIFDKSQFITTSGFLIEIKRLPYNPITKDTPTVLTRGFLGVETKTPFCATVAGLRGGPLIDEFASLYDLLDEEIAAFKRNTKIDCDILFLPFGSQETECNQFAYCFLLDLIEKTKDQTDIHAAQEAKNRLQEIEQLEGMKAEDLLKSLEQSIKADFKTQYELQVEKEQQQRSAAVSSGITPTLNPAGKVKKDSRRKQYEKKEPEKDSRKDLDRLAEEEFVDLQLHGRVRYRRMLKMVGKVLKKNPELFKGDNQRGSHHALHMSQGGATLAQPHGRQDNTLSPQTAKKFMKKIIDQVNRSLTGQTPL